MTRHRPTAGVVATLFAVVVAAGCGSRQLLPPGTFAGTTASGGELTIVVRSTKVEVNGTEARQRADGTLLADELPDDPRLDCEPQADGEELRCDITRGERHETVELVRL